MRRAAVIIVTVAFRRLCPEPHPPLPMATQPLTFVTYTAPAVPNPPPQMTDEQIREMIQGPGDVEWS